MSDYKHDMRHLSCRLNLCRHQPTTKSKVKHGARKISIQQGERATRENIECTECGSWNCKQGRFVIKCYDCGLMVDCD